MARVAGSTVVAGMLLVGWVGSASAQAFGTPVPTSPWTVGGSAAVWGAVPTESADPRPNGRAFDVSVARRLGGGQSPFSLRVETGRGEGAGGRQPGFDYTRVIVGIVRTLQSASAAPFTVYLAGGGGRYAVRTSLMHDTKASVFGAIGLDVRPGSSPISFGAELQVQTVGDGLYGTTSLQARLHF